MMDYKARKFIPGMGRDFFVKPEHIDAKGGAEKFVPGLGTAFKVPVDAKGGAEKYIPGLGISFTVKPEHATSSLLTLTGYVTYSDTELPVEGAEVAIIQFEDHNAFMPLSDPLFGITDEFGMVVIAGVQRTWSHIHVFIPGDYNYLPLSITADLSQVTGEELGTVEDPYNIILSTQPHIDLRFSILNQEDSLPIQGASIAFTVPSGVTTLTTDENGIATLADLSPTEDGSISFTISRAGYYDSSFESYQVFPYIAGEILYLDFELISEL